MKLSAGLCITAALLLLFLTNTATSTRLHLKLNRLRARTVHHEGDSLLESNEKQTPTAGVPVVAPAVSPAPATTPAPAPALFHPIVPGQPNLKPAIVADHFGYVHSPTLPSKRQDGSTIHYHEPKYIDEEHPRFELHNFPYPHLRPVAPPNFFPGFSGQFGFPSQFGFPNPQFFHPGAAASFYNSPEFEAHQAQAADTLENMHQYFHPDAWPHFVVRPNDGGASMPPEVLEHLRLMSLAEQNENLDETQQAKNQDKAHTEKHVTQKEEDKKSEDSKRSGSDINSFISKDQSASLAEQDQDQDQEEEEYEEDEADNPSWGGADDESLLEENADMTLQAGATPGKKGGAMGALGKKGAAAGATGGAAGASGNPTYILPMNPFGAGFSPFSPFYPASQINPFNPMAASMASYYGMGYNNPLTMGGFGMAPPPTYPNYYGMVMNGMMDMRGGAAPGMTPGIPIGSNAAPTQRFPQFLETGEEEELRDQDGAEEDEDNEEAIDEDEYEQEQHRQKNHKDQKVTSFLETNAARTAEHLYNENTDKQQQQTQAQQHSQDYPYLVQPHIMLDGNTDEAPLQGTLKPATVMKVPPHYVIWNSHEKETPTITNRKRANEIKRQNRNLRLMQMEKEYKEGQAEAEGANMIPDAVYPDRCVGCNWVMDTHAPLRVDNLNAA